MINSHWTWNNMGWGSFHFEITWNEKLSLILVHPWSMIHPISCWLTMENKLQSRSDRDFKSFKWLLVRNLHCVKKCPYSVLFWSAFPRIWIEYGKIRSISPYLTPNTDTFHADLTYWERFTFFWKVVSKLKHFLYFWGSLPCCNCR